MPDSQFTSIHIFLRIFDQICWARVIFCGVIKRDMTDRLSGQTQQLIWVGGGNLRFLQVNYNYLSNFQFWKQKIRAKWSVQV